MVMGLPVEERMKWVLSGLGRMRGRVFVWAGLEAGAAAALSIAKRACGENLRGMVGSGRCRIVSPNLASVAGVQVPYPPRFVRAEPPLLTADAMDNTTLPRRWNST